MKTKHTTGPWNREKTTYRHAVVDNAQNGTWEFVAETTSKANADLIAAAPDLLVALKAFIEMPGHVDKEKVKALIAKAEGGAE